MKKLALIVIMTCMLSIVASSVVQAALSIYQRGPYCEMIYGGIDNLQQRASVVIGWHVVGNGPVDVYAFLDRFRGEEPLTVSAEGFSHDVGDDPTPRVVATSVTDNGHWLATDEWPAIRDGFTIIDDAFIRFLMETDEPRTFEFAATNGDWMRVELDHTQASVSRVMSCVNSAE